MVKILSQSGISLADVYDVEGSIAGIEQLESGDVTLVHEMGQTLFSERFSTFIRRASSGDIAQNNDFNVLLEDLPGVPTRLLGVTVITDVPARVLRANVLVRDPFAGTFGREALVWTWDGVNDIEVHMVDGAASTLHFALVPSLGLSPLPSFCGGKQQPQISNELMLRGRTTGFGAGTVVITALYYIAFSQIGGISSKGLQIPSW